MYILYLGPQGFDNNLTKPVTMMVFPKASSIAIYIFHFPCNTLQLTFDTRAHVTVLLRTQVIIFYMKLTLDKRYFYD
jgi:hypothetical protein